MVFLNIHRFHPKKERVTDDSCGHRNLKKQLKEFFQDIMVPYSREHKNITFRNCWNTGKRLFVFYRHGSYRKEKFLWPGMQVTKLIILEVIE